MEFSRCYSCMKQLHTPGEVCPYCGYDNTNGPRQQPSHVLACGTVLNGKYVVGRSLGQGGFGITYICYDLMLDVPVCIKEFYPEGSAMRSASRSCQVYWGTSEMAQSQRQSRENFVKEARKAARLRNLYAVVKVWDVFYENETAYLVMDYIEGETLSRYLRRTNRLLGEEECIRLLLPIMRELGEVHAQGIIHRDIKPDNLMRRPNGSLVVLDFGAAKDLSGDKKGQGGMLSTTLVASQGFSPIEQYSKKGQIGPWTDVYAICATIVYCCTGKLPPTPIERVSGEEINLSAFNPAIAAVLAHGLEVQPPQRIQTMGELQKELDDALTAMNSRKREEEEAERRRAEEAERRRAEEAAREAQRKRDEAAALAEQEKKRIEEEKALAAQREREEAARQAELERRRKAEEAAREAQRRKEERAAQEEQRRREKAAQEEQRRREKAAQEEQRQREKAAQEEQRRREKAAQEEQRQREKAIRDEQKRQEKLAREANKTQERGGGEKKPPITKLLIAAAAVVLVIIGIVALTRKPDNGNPAVHSPEVKQSAVPAIITPKPSLDVGLLPKPSDPTPEPAEPTPEPSNPTPEPETPQGGAAAAAPLSQAQVGSYVVFGSYEQDNNAGNGKEDIEWLVLARDGSRILVISRYALDCQPYNSYKANVTWATSSLRKWLGDSFLKTAFSKEEQAKIQTVTVSADSNLTYTDPTPGAETQDKVFLLSIPEAESYFSDQNARVGQPTAYAAAQSSDVSQGSGALWWLRTPGAGQDRAASVKTGGGIKDSGNEVAEIHAVRPALWIDVS